MKRVEQSLGGVAFEDMTASHVMEPDVYFYGKSATGHKISTALTMGGFGSVPIVDGDKTVLGIVSEFDLLRAILEGRTLDQVRAEEIMTKDPVCVAEDTKVLEIMAVLDKKHLIRVPVTDRERRLVGVVARRDLLLGYLKSKETPPPWW